MMSSDASSVHLLKQYAASHDEAAFEQIVRQHVDMVYSAARRRVGDRHLAEDVTQAVFVILAKKAGSIRDDTSLGPWLLQTVRYTAANALRMEARQRRREEAAATMCTATAVSSNDPSDAMQWQEVAQYLDDAVLKLPARDRQAVILRYFEDKPVAQIAVALNVSEGAAQRRLGRAVERLRKLLRRRGASTLEMIPAEALAVLLTANATEAAPAGLASAARAAAAGTAETAAAYLIAKGAMNMMAWTPAKIVAATVGVVLLGGAGGVITINHALAQDNQKPAPNQRQAPVARPAVRAPGFAVPGRVVAAAPARPITSVATAPPVVVSTIPQAGATDVDPSLAEIRVTFSREMESGSFAASAIDRERFPTTTASASALPDDKRTWTLPVKLEAGKTYVVQMYNSRAADGRSAMPYVLVFETKP